MPKLPTDVSGREAVRAFQRAGWVVRRWGPHIILEKEGLRPTLSVPDHRSLDRGTLRALLRHADLSVDDFLRLLP